MGVFEVRDRLAAIGAEIEGVRKAFSFIPRVLQHAELPAFIAFASEAQYAVGSDTVQEQRVWRCVVFVDEIGDGIEGSVEETAYLYIDRLRDTFAGRPGLETLSDPDGLATFNAIPVGDSAVTILEYPQGSGKRYYAVECRVLVEDHIRRNFISS